ncbi:MAG TPA: hypothetical protein DHV36_06090 [Desulfobacteraceae bacterium]|nr:hypothetical protein [Desulfobacteraceae bacterium]
MTIRNHIVPLALLLVFSLFYFFPGPVRATVPEVLTPWKEWVLHGREAQIACVPRFNDPDTVRCAWPGRLEMDLTGSGGRFTQEWLVSLDDTRVILPGSSRYWPREVTINGEPAVVLERNGAPVVFLPRGTHTVTGSFVWSRMPEHLQTPKDSGLLSLSIENTSVPFPNLDDRGRLWLKHGVKEEKIENRLKIDCFRLVDDEIPARVQVHLSLDVAGAARQITLGPLYGPDRFTPVSLNSPLPAKLEQDGSMKVQVRPGMFAIRLNLRHKGPLKALEFTPVQNPFWPAQEVWSFRAQPDLRLTEITGASPIDPQQTNMPADWKQYPAYLMGAGDALTFKEIKRGDPAPAPDQLDLERELWLRFDGRGYTVRDSIRGKKNTGWRLEMSPEISLGSVTVDGREQLITRRRGSDKAGIELRNGRLNFSAVSTIDGRPSALPATGWDEDFKTVKGRLHLPPGWKLIHGTGMDSISRTWIQQWTLLDFFIVLIFTIALAKLSSKKMAPLAFVTLVLVWHEPQAPKFIWLALLAGIALLTYLPEGRFRTGVKICQALAVLAFIVIVIPYSITALRVGIYPQLEQPWTSMSEYGGWLTKKRAAMEDNAVQEEMVRQQVPQALRKTVKSTAGAPRILSSVSEPAGGEVMQYDPKALTQTGPGLPGWQPFETVRFGWSGPVTRDQIIRFTLIGPKANLVLAFARVGLIIFLALGLLGVNYRRGKGLGISWPRGQTAALLILPLMLFSGILFPGQGQAGEIPSQAMLEQLRERLLEKDPCFPSCAAVRSLSLAIGPDRLSMALAVDTRVDAAVPLPGNTRQWLPSAVSLDGKAADGLFREDSHLWIMVPKGRHTVSLSGPVRRQNVFQLPFNLRPRDLTVSADGWSVDGQHPDGSFEDTLRFKRVVAGDDQKKELLETGELPGFARVERTLRLGLVWKVHTRVRRLSPPGSGMVLNIPLLPGESVTSQGIRVKEGIARVSLKAGQTDLEWESFLEKTGRIRMEHPQTDEWTEVWKVDVSPVFHMDYDGIPVIFHKTGSLWFPTWHPWPGESVSLTLTRPGGVEGRTLTVEKTHLELWPGRNTTRARLDLSIKSSQGGRHPVTLPEGAGLQEVSINGKIHPIRQNGRIVALPITPGSQQIRLSWLETRGISTRFTSPGVDLGLPSVNAGVDIHLPRNRWPLFIGGEQLMGPAVLFWSVLIIIFLLALGLSRTGWASLKFHHWFLLCLGMSMSHLAAGLLMVGWLIALDFRGKAAKMRDTGFNLVQLGLVLLTLAALAALVGAVSNGLLGHPDMNIRGNGSSAGLLRWYHDISGPVLPEAWVVSIPMLAYRIAMLAWALWIAFWLVGTLKWGWQRFSTPDIWRKVQLRKKKKTQEG